MEEYTISKEYLDKILDQSARTLVGTLLKKIEVLEKEQILSSTIFKSLTKDAVYENFRSLKALINSFTCGVKFISKPEEKSKE